MIYLHRILPVLGLFLATIVLKAQPSIGHYHVYYGHLHNYSEVSDGTDSPELAYQYARDSGHLDFFALTDHSEQIHGDSPTLY